LAKSNEPRRQHLVPNFYLRRFANANHQVAVVNRVTGERTVQKTDNVMVEHNFYTFQSTAGEISYQLEKLLSGIEGAGGAAIKRIVAGFFAPSPADRDALATLMAFQLVRSRKVRKQQEMSADAYQKVLLRGLGEDEVRTRLGARGRPATDEEVKAVMDSLADLDTMEIVPPPEEHLKTMLHLAPQLFPHLVNMRIHVVEWKERSLLTSDHPIVYFKRNRHPLMGFGLENCDEVWFPVDPRHLLLLTHARPFDPPERVLPGTPEFAREVNHLVAWHAYEWIVTHPDHDPVAEIPDFKFEAPPLVEVMSDAGLADFAALAKPPQRRSPHRGRKRRESRST
jgi:hypothetical protein